MLKRLAACVALVSFLTPCNAQAGREYSGWRQIPSKHRYMYRWSNKDGNCYTFRTYTGTCSKCGGTHAMPQQTVVPQKEETTPSVAKPLVVAKPQPPSPKVETVEHREIYRNFGPQIESKVYGSVVLQGSKSGKSFTMTLPIINGLVPDVEKSKDERGTVWVYDYSAKIPYEDAETPESVPRKPTVEVEPEVVPTPTAPPTPANGLQRPSDIAGGDTK